MEDCFLLSPEERGLSQISLGYGTVFPLTTSSCEAAISLMLESSQYWNYLKSVCFFLVGLFGISAWGLLWKVLFNLFLKVKRF